MSSSILTVSLLRVPTLVIKSFTSRFLWIDYADGKPLNCANTISKNSFSSGLISISS
jgi:hypothetical protein